MKYLIGALVILALLFLVWWFLSRGKQAKLDEQRAEAARIRAGAEERGSVLRGQETFVQQSDERASAARQEAEAKARQAEESAREAQRVEDEARRHQEELERARLARDAELRRADEIDPDVTVADGDPRPLPEDLDDDVRPLDETRVHAPVPAAGSAAPSMSEPVTPESVTPEVEPETRVHTPVRPAAETSAAPAASEPVAEPVADSAPEATRDRGSWGAGAAVAGAGAAAVGSAYAATRGNVSDDEAARLASGADYADNAPVDEPGNVEPPAEATADEPVFEAPVDEPVAVEAPAEEPLVSERTTQGWDAAETSEPETSEIEAPASDVAEVESGDLDHLGSTDEVEGDTAIIGNVEDYASTEPLPAESSVAEDSTTELADDGVSTYDGSQDDFAQADVTATDDAAVNDELVTTTEPIAQDAPEDAPAAQEVAVDDTSADDTPTEEWTAAEEPTTEETWEEPETTEPSAEVPAEAPVEAEGSVATDAPVESAGEAFGSEAGTETETATATATETETSDVSAATDTDAVDATVDDGDATHWPDGTDRINPVDGDPAGETDVAASDSDGSNEGFVQDGAADAGFASDEPASDEPASDEPVSDEPLSDEPVSDEPVTDEPDGDDTGGSDTGGSGSEGEGWSRRISTVEEIRDGGYGVGSAAPFEDRAQPADHPVQAYNDTRTFRVPGASGYDSAEPDVWFYDEEAARRAGFTPSES